MSNLVEIRDDGVFVSTQTLAAQEGFPRNKNLLATIRAHLEDFERFGQVAFKTRIANSSHGGGRRVEYALLNEHQTTLLFLHLRNSPKVREIKVTLVAEFYEMAHRLKEIDKEDSLPAPAPQTMLPAQVALETAKAELELARLFKVPESYAVQQIARIVSAQSGIDHTKLLTQAEAMNNVPAEDIMLEPTELGRRYGLSAVQMNKVLQQWGLQVKWGKQWLPTEAGKALCEDHGWIKGNKSGYNLKWRVKEIQKYFEPTTR